MESLNGERGVSMNVLIVEDNAEDLRLLRHTLERHGCTVIEARDGEEGLDLAIRNLSAAPRTCSKTGALKM